MSDSAVLVTIFGLGAAISWGFSNFMSAKASKSLGPISSAFLVNLIGAVVFALAYALGLRPDGHSHMTAVAFAFAASSGVVFTVGALAFFKGLAAGPVSIVAPLSGTYPLLMTLLAVVVFRAHLSLQEFLGILLVVAGALTAAELLNAKRQVRKLGPGPAWAFLTAAGWGAAYALLDQAIKRMGWQTSTLLELSFAAVAFVAFAPFVKGDERFTFTVLRRMILNKFVLIAGVVQLIGMLALNFGLAKEGGSGAVVTAISSCYPVLTMMLALRHFDERIKLIPLAGALVSIAGVVILSLG